MAMDLAAMAEIISHENFKAQRRDAEKLSSDFDLPLKSFKFLLTITGNGGTASNKKKPLLRFVGGLDMDWLFDYIVKVLADTKYTVAITNIKIGKLSRQQGKRVRGVKEAIGGSEH